MMEQAEDIARHFEVGALALIQLRPARSESPRLRTVIRGWRVGSHLILDRPKEPGEGWAKLEQGIACVVRFLADGCACAFSVPVLTWETHNSNPTMRIGWPHALEFATVRKYERLSIHVPCAVGLEDRTQATGEVVDISAGGCSLNVSAPLARKQKTKIDFKLPDGYPINGLEIEICSVTVLNETRHCGCKFVNTRDERAEAIAFHVTAAIASRRNGDRKDARPLLLVAEANPDVSRALRERFAKEGFDAIGAASTVDLFHYLKTVRPVAALLCQTMPDLPGTDICRVLRQARGFETFPVFIYAFEEANADALAKKAGAAAGFGSARESGDKIVQAVQEILVKS